MQTIHRRSQQPAIPRYSENAALQLIIASGVTFVTYHFTRIVMLIVGVDDEQVFQWLVPNIALPSAAQYVSKFWTILTYGWVHEGFWDWFTNMIWLFCFGSVLQSLVGYKQVIPLYLIALISGGAFYLGGQMIPGSMFEVGNHYFMGAQAGVTSLGIAALTLAPKQRMYLSPQFSIPLVIVVSVYLVLNLVVTLPDDMRILMIHAGGAAAGLIYAWQLRNGARPGDWLYSTLSRVERIASPDEERIRERRHKKRNEVLRTMYEAKAGISQQRIDEILDKINERGYYSLSREEKELLMRASKD